MRNEQYIERMQNSIDSFKEELAKCLELVNFVTEKKKSIARLIK